MLSFQVMAPRPLLLSPHSPDLRCMYVNTPTIDSVFNSTKTIKPVTTFIRSIRFMLRTPPPEALVSSYGTKTITTVTTLTRLDTCMWTPLSETLFSNYSKTIMLPPPSDLSDTCWKHGRRKLHFQVTSYGTKTITTVTTFTRSFFGNPYSLGYLNYFFDRVCDPRSGTPTHIYKNFSPSKKGWFLKVFENWDPFLRVFHLENSWFFKKI